MPHGSRTRASGSESRHSEGFEPIQPGSQVVKHQPPGRVRNPIRLTKWYRHCRQKRRNSSTHLRRQSSWKQVNRRIVARNTTGSHGAVPFRRGASVFGTGSEAYLKFARSRSAVQTINGRGGPITSFPGNHAGGLRTAFNEILPVAGDYTVKFHCIPRGELLWVGDMKVEVRPPCDPPSNPQTAR
jgi:hypothetical protein